MKKKTRNTVLVILVVGLLSLAFRDPDYGEWNVPPGPGEAVTRIGNNIGDGVQYVADLTRQKNREMQDVHDSRMDRNDRRIEESGGREFDE